MATLEKIRKKSVLLLIIIGAALIAFIIGDFLNSGRNIFGSGTTVAEVDGEKIDYMQFQQRYSQVTENNRQSSQMDPAMMQNQVLEQMIGEILLNEEYDALGIEVSDKELSDYMFKQMIRTNPGFQQQLSSFAQALQAPVELKDPNKPEQFVQDFYTFVFSPSKFGRQEDEGITQARAWWIGLEKDAAEQLKQMKLYRLLGGTTVANNLDREAMKQEMGNSYEVRMVAVPYASLDDKDYAVSDDEVKAVYDREKERFALRQEMRKAHYIAVPIVPSAADNEKADKFLASVDSTLHATAGVDGVRHFTELTVTEGEYRASDLTRMPDMKKFVDSVAVGAISKINRSGDNRTIYRLLEKKQEADSVKLLFVSVAGNKARQDSVLAKLNGGAAVDAVANGETIVKEDTATVDLIAAAAQGQLSQDLKSKILTAGDQFFVFQSGNEGAALCKVTARMTPKTIFKVATVAYTVSASKETRGNLLNALQKYVDANNTAKTFAENAAKSEQHYAAQSTVLTEDSPVLGTQYNYVKSSAKLIQWLFKDAEKGDVSAIQTDNDQYVVVALDDVYDGDYMPLTDSDVRVYCETKARNEKKGEALMKKYQGKAQNIAGYEAAMGTPVRTVRVGGGVPGMDPILAGQAPFAKLNKLYGPVKGDAMVFVYQVVKKEAAANPITDQQVDMSYRQQFMMFNNIFEVLKDNKDVENHIVNFR